jgi:transcription elongation factor GreA
MSSQSMLEAIQQKLADEIDRLNHELSVILPAAIKKAVELGDLSENAEYKSAIERQQFVQARLSHLRQRAGEISRIDPKQISPDQVGFGSRVTVRDVESGDLIQYTIVFGDFIDLDSNQISMASPIGRALIGKALGDVVLVNLPRGDVRYEITDLVTLPQMVKS